MKQIRIIALLMAAALLAVFCVGCAKAPDETLATAAPTEEAEPSPTDAATEVPTESAGATETVSADVIPVRMRNGKLSFLPEEPISIPKLSEMEYVRPNADTLIARIDALTEKVAGCEDAEALLADYYEIAPDIQSFASMYALAFYHYCMDTSDSYYADEYDYCDEQGTLVDEKENALYAAFAASPCRGALEQAYFGEGFFKDYDDFNAADENYFDLKQQENDLLFRYYDFANTISPYSYKQIEDNHDAMGGIYIELVKVRQQIAAAKGYGNYMDYSYDCTFKRDYTTAQAREYLDGVKELLAPLMENPKIADDYSYYSSWRESAAMDMLSSAAERMGGPVWEAYRFMAGHELYDVSYATDKLGIAFTSYLADYESPFIFVNPDAKDLLISLFHEFGHFTDAYRNYGFSDSYEIGETHSQAMQYLAFAYADGFADNFRSKNLRATLSDLLVESILKEGAYGDFELQVYSLAPEELTIERLDAIYAQCMEDYGLSGMRGVQFKSKYWSAYNHFFERPGYLISYSVSAVSALQICRLEAEEAGAGVEAFCRLLDRAPGQRFSAAIDEAGLDSPFDTAAMERTAEFLKDVFDMN